MNMILDTSLLAIANLPTDYPRLFGWFASSVSALAVLKFLWSYWNRPIINVELNSRAGSHGSVMTDLKNIHGITGQGEVKYFRILIQNAGLTTIKDCRGHLIKVTRRVGKKAESFASERHPLGWANYPESKKRDIPSGADFHMDVATLLLSAGRSALHWPDAMPNTLGAFLGSYQGRARYTFYVRIDADNARPRIIPVEIGFDPKKSELAFVPLNTRFPLWKSWWWPRALWARRQWKKGGG
jgi:hypothetical protein